MATNSICLETIKKIKKTLKGARIISNITITAIMSFILFEIKIYKY